MKHLTVKFRLDSAAFADGNDAREVARILRDAAARIEAGGVNDFQLADMNGNPVGNVIHLDEDDAYIAAVKELADAQGNVIDGELEIDSDATTSDGDDNGTYLQTWLWVDFEGTDLDKGDDGEDGEDDSEHDDVCDTCMRSGVEIARTDEAGNTICVDCDDDTPIPLEIPK